MDDPYRETIRINEATGSGYDYIRMASDILPPMLDNVDHDRTLLPPLRPMTHPDGPGRAYS
jgi:hypothetical protein